MAAVTICSDFGAQKNKSSHCFHCFPIDLHEVMGINRLLKKSKGKLKMYKMVVYFVNKGMSSQGYGFSSGHVWM